MGAWEQKVALKRDLRAKALAAEEFQTAPQDLSVTDINDIGELAQKIANGDLSAEHVVRAYVKRAIDAQDATNCLTEVFFQDALHEAKELDSYRAREKKPKGPLHGVVMTLKDQFNVKGYDTTIGYLGRAFKPVEADAILVEMLKELGVVFIAKTNLPQSIMWCETENPLWGLTTNPVSKDYTPGGSTGGESALLALHGSCIGWGTDIGGSVRIPSHMMGIYGLKPSSARLPYSGVPVSTEGQEHVPSSIGPLARSLSSLTTVLKELVLLKPWERDARCAPIPWREDVYQEIQSRPLTIGILINDGVVRPHPPIYDAFEGLTELLTKAGHDVVEWNADLHPECIQVMDEYYTADGGEDIRLDVMAGGEPFIPHVEKLVNKGKPISVYEYWQLNRRKVALQQKYLAKWNGLKSAKTGKPVDILIMPVMPHASVPHRGCRWVGYTKVWNILDYTAMAIPFSKYSNDPKYLADDFKPMNEVDAWNHDVWEKNKLQMMELGLPFGLQIVGRRLEEEKVLAAGAVIEGILRQKS